MAQHEAIVGTPPTRKMVSHKLAIKDDVHYAKNAKALRQFLIEHMAKVNRQADHAAAQKPESQSIATFWDKTYELGFTTNKKHSTSLSYSQIYDQHLKSHLAPFALATYRTSHASKYLTGLAKKGYGRNTISHVRSLMSGLFFHAVNLGLIDYNPLIGAKSLSKWTCINIRIA